MTTPRGNRGPEAVRPLDRPAAERGGQALAAAPGNDWPRAQRLLDGLTADELETLASVALRLGRRAKWQALGALYHRAGIAIRAGARPRSWNEALDMARGDSRSLRSPTRAVAAASGHFGLPDLTVVPRDED